MLVLVPLSLTSFTSWANSANDQIAREQIEEWLGTDRDLDLVQLEVDGATVDVVLTGSDQPPDVGQLEVDLDESFGEEVDLSMRVVPSVLYTE